MASTVLGDGKCPFCGHGVTFKESTRGRITFICPVPGDGGCGTQVFSRSDKSSNILARNVKKWRDADARKRYNGQEASEPEVTETSERKPEAKPKASHKPKVPFPRKADPVEPDERPEPPVNVKPKASFWDREF